MCVGLGKPKKRSFFNDPATKLEGLGVKALVAGPLKILFCGFPYGAGVRGVYRGGG